MVTLQATRSVTDSAARAAMASNATPSTCSAIYTYNTSSIPPPLVASRLQLSVTVTCPRNSSDKKTHVTVAASYPFQFFLPVFSRNSDTISDTTTLVF